MTHQAEATRTIAVSASELWATITAMTGMEDWYPGLIRTSTVSDSEDAQPKRHCVMQDGGELHERILLRDDATRTFIYAIDRHPLPARNVVGTIRIDDLGDDRSYAVWSARMQLDESVAGQVVPMIADVYAAGLEALETRHTS